jgi:hypothetical protein
MPAKINLLNQTFGKLLVIEETPKRKNKSVVWKCRCECNNIEEFSTKELRSDGVIQCHQCGDTREPKIKLTEDIIGKKFNHLTVLEKTCEKQGGKILYKCECDCIHKNIVYTNRTDLISGHTKSCGCIKRKFQIGDKINNRELLELVPSNRNEARYKCKCLLCNNIYEATTQTLQKTISCGCQKSIGEFNIIQILNKNNIPFIKEYCVNNYRFDFAILNNNNEVIRLIEFDGEQHYKNKFGEKEFYEIVYHDAIKNSYCEDNNINLLRIPFWDIANMKDIITREIEKLSKTFNGQVS